MNCPVCGNTHIYTYEKHINFERVPYQECHTCGWRSDEPYITVKKEEKIEEKETPKIPDACPVCGGPIIEEYDKGTVYSCLNCHYKYRATYEKQPDPNNPYTEFAKEMSLLHEALKAEGFKDAMVDILAAMAPEVWKKVQFEEQKDFLHKTLGIDTDRMIKEIRENDNWQRIRKEVMCNENNS